MIPTMKQHSTDFMWPKNTEPYIHVEGYASWIQSRVPMKFERLDVPPQTQHKHRLCLALYACACSGVRPTCTY